MDPQGEPDLDAIARDLVEVEAELDRLADGTYGDDRTPSDPAAP
jgi:predicted subunit of tRNA(5-methylaminomethyl-2-thiouridylate) methyltransferase